MLSHAFIIKANSIEALLKAGQKNPKLYEYECNVFNIAPHTIYVARNTLFNGYTALRLFDWKHFYLVHHITFYINVKS